ncbi:FAD binding domain-containing protein [Colletotrichum karsti]|uniref:FAD binding domain-containing protein n=1 Tax=Colletotrichum karsti TaxID=1095194 RepID=A0A9P6LK26_9PEZI|nr:FAD binding domain-containing protein [Colletotrichum karsti]KAF9876298.1 FAD binding domain-containing protein [Colletotrichum karsti]
MSAPPLPILYAEDTPFTDYSLAVWGRVFNALRDFSRRPVAVVRATHRAHVAEAVRLAAEKGWRVSVRSGGHSWAAWSVRDEALLLDLGGLGKDDIAYDRSTGVVSVAPARTGREVNGFLAGQIGGPGDESEEGVGRWFPGGHCPDVGLGGFLLQGGMGWNCKNWGWACENIEAIEVVTADGRELRCSETENADLFWAARGSGPGFPAIVTRFHLRTRPLTGMYQSLYFYSLDRFEEILNWVIKICPTAAPTTEIVLLTLTPPGADSPQVMANFLSFGPNPEPLIPLHSSHPPRPLATVFANPTSLPQQYVDQDAANPPAHRYVSENAYVSNDADVPAVLKKAFTTLPTPQSFALYFSMNPCSRRRQQQLGEKKDAETTMPDMALSMQSDHYFALYTIYPDAEDDERCQGWVSDVMKEVERKSAGSYLGDADFRLRRTKFWGDEQGKRLMEVRRAWDPQGRICGYLDADDKSGAEGLKNEFEWA